MRQEERKAESLSELLRTLNWVPPVRLSALWAAAVGALLAQHTKVVGHTAKDLFIEVDSEAWLDQVARHEEELLARLASLGQTGFERLHLQLLSAKEQELPKTPKRFLKPEVQAQIQDYVKEIESPRVKSALGRFFARLAEEEEKT